MAAHVNVFNKGFVIENIMVLGSVSKNPRRGERVDLSFASDDVRDTRQAGGDLPCDMTAGAYCCVV